MSRKGAENDAIDSLRKIIADRRREHSGSRKRYPAGVRESSLKLITEGVPIATLARQLEVHPSLLYSWQKRPRSKSRRKSDASKGRTDEVRPRVLTVRRSPTLPPPAKSSCLVFVKIAGLVFSLRRSE